MKLRPGKPMQMQFYARSYSGLNSSIYWRMFDSAGNWITGGLTHPMGVPDLVGMQLARVKRESERPRQP